MRGKPSRRPSRSTVPTGPSGAVTERSSPHPPGVLAFTYNTETSSVTERSPNSIEVLGVAPQHLSIHGALFLAYVHPADRFGTEVLLDTALREGTPYVATYRWIRPDSNEVRFIHCRATRIPATPLFKGMMIDITSEASKLRAEGDLALSIGDLLKHLALPGITLDNELTIRAVHLQPHHPALSLGVTDLDYEKLRPGVSLIDCVTRGDSRTKIQDTFEKLLTPHATPLSFTVDGFETIAHPLYADGIVHGVAIFTLDKRGEHKALEHAAALEQELKEAHSYRSLRAHIITATQEIAGYGALITRHSRANPLLAAISDSLLQSIRELAATTDRLHRPTQPIGGARSTSPRRRRGVTPFTAKRTPSAHVIFVSESPRCATSHTLALRDSGVPCATAPYDEHELLELLRAAHRIEVVLLDAPRNEGECAPLVRRLKRAAPHILVVCLASNDPTTHANLLRAGAVTVLSKPASMREVEKVTRKLLALRDQHSVANG